MKRITILFISIFTITILAIQTGRAMEDEGIKKDLLKNIQNLWQAWQAQNPEPFKQWLWQDGITITGQGVTKVSDLLEEIANKQCQVKSFAIDESSARLTKIDDKTYVITYKADQDATCNGAKVPTPVTVSEIWSNKDGKWKGYFYQETPLMSK